MTTFADLDAPRRSRARDLLMGALMGLPVALLIAYLVIPLFMGTVLGETGEFDQRLRQEDAYLSAVCTAAMNLERDEALCKCVLAVEYPALDCRGPFLRWSLERHANACVDETTRKQSISFCACIEAVSARVQEAEAAGDAPQTRAEEARTARCLELEDAFPLPTVEVLTEGT